jgi:imidazoleglycerol phosphate synthase glutamine amidotransferase subunit HisH
MPTVHLLDYVAGNVRSLVNAIEKLGWTVEWVKTPADVAKANVCFTVTPSFEGKRVQYSID